MTLGEKQFCQICHQMVRETDPAKLRGGEMLQICTRCRSAFPGRRKHEWGNRKFQYYWDLGSQGVPICESRAGLLEWEADLTGAQVAILRAAGYLVARKEQEDGEEGQA